MITKIKTLGFAYPLLCILACNNHATSPESVMTQADVNASVEKQEMIQSQIDSSAENFKTVIKVKDDCHTRTQTALSLDSKLKAIDVPDQVFFCSSDKDTVLLCAQGTKVKINKNTLVDAQSGKAIRGDVVVKIKEYCDIGDAVVANLSTACGDKILESGGMIYIEIFSGHNKCALKKDESIALEFAGQSAQGNKQLFEGSFSDGRMDWKPLDRSVNIVRIQSETSYNSVARFDIYTDAQTVSYDGTHIIEYPSAALEQNLIGEVTLRYGKLKDDRNTKLFITSSTNSIFNKAAHWMITNMLRNKALIFGKESDLLQNAIHVHFVLGKERISTNQLIAARRFDEMIAPVQYNYLSEGNFIEPNNNDGKNMMKEWEKEAMYSFKSSKLGWINCDSFIPEKDHCIALNFPMSNKYDSRAYLIFTKRKSILQGYFNKGKVNFDNIPKNEEIVLVVIKDLGENIAIAKRKFKAADYKSVSLEYKPIGIESLKNYLTI